MLTTWPTLWWTPLLCNYHITWSGTHEGLSPLSEVSADPSLLRVWSLPAPWPSWPLSAFAAPCLMPPLMWSLFLPPPLPLSVFTSPFTPVPPALYHSQPIVTFHQLENFKSISWFISHNAMQKGQGSSLRDTASKNVRIWYGWSVRVNFRHRIA